MLQILMYDPEEWNQEKSRGFLPNDPGADYQAGSRQELYGWTQATLVQPASLRCRVPAARNAGYISAGPAPNSCGRPFMNMPPYRYPAAPGPELSTNSNGPPPETIPS